MFRAMRNVLLLLVVSFIASGIPLYADTPDFTNQLIGTAIKSNLSLNVQLNHVISTQWDVEVTLSTDGKAFPVKFNSTNPISMGLYYDDLHIKNLNLGQLNNNLSSLDEVIEITKDNPIIFNFSIKQDEINIPDGDYRLEVKVNIDDLDQPIPPFNVAINFETDLQYIPALQSIDRNETALLLYFPDQEYNQLIPITRVIPYTNTPLRVTLANLEKGPISELGLPVNSPIPANAGLRLNRGITNVYLPADLGKYNENPTDAAMALGSFVNSLTSIDGVNGVQFYFGNRIQQTGFHGEMMKEPHYPSSKSMIYVGTITNTNRALLTPIVVYDDNPSVELIFEKLKYSGNINFYHYRLQPPLPETVELLSHNLEEGILTLELNQVFLDVYSKNISKQALMLESILYSFTSIPGVEEVVIQVNGEPISSFGGLELAGPMKPSKYINPEK